MSKLRVLDLFSGIGGFSLGLERTGGFETVAFCEIDPYCRRVLAKHWPGVPCHEDITRLDGAQYRGRVDVVCGGFPCQDISSAAARPRAGLNGARSGLWSEMRRVVGEVRPRLVLVENSADLLVIDRGAHARAIFGDLAALGFDAEWHVMGAVAVDAPHERERVWIIASDANRHSKHGGAVDAEVAEAQEFASDANCLAPIGAAISRQECRPWPDEPAVSRVAYGVPRQSQRRAALGNSVVPQIPELIGRAILAAEEAAA